jgi:hypothetical protein
MAGKFEFGFPFSVFRCPLSVVRCPFPGSGPVFVFVVRCVARG